MINHDALLSILHINGINESSTKEQVEFVFNALKYSPEEKEQAYAFLKSQNWSVASSVVSEQVVQTTQPATPVSTPINPLPPIQNIASVIPEASIAQNPISEPSGYQLNQIPQGGEHSKKNIVLYSVVGMLVLVGIVGAVLYAKQSGLFVKSYYSENTIVGGLLVKTLEIQSSSYTVTFSLNTSARDSDAKPFVLPANTETADSLQKYQNDVTRVSNIQKVLSELKYRGPQTSYSYDPITKSTKNVDVPGSTYPISLDSMKSANTNSYYNFQTTDPITNRAYQYTVTNGGKNFSLVADFDTDAAIGTVRKTYGYTATTTIIKGHQVTFTKDSYDFPYFPETPPQPFLMQMAESARMIPNDLSGALSIGATTDFSKKVADWLFNVDATGSFGDLSYAVNVEARKKDKNYYFRINKMPSFFSEISLMKGKWVVISPEASSTNTNSFSMLGMIASNISKQDDSYTANRQKVAQIIKTITTIADNNKLILFKSSPKQETVNGQTLTRYDLTIRKESIIPFYKDLMKESEKNPDLSGITDDGTLSYLQSPEFEAVYNYLNTNTFLTLWVDGNGFPADMQIRFRIVPPDTATQFKDKQINIALKLSYKDINKPVSVDIPSGAIPVQQLIDQAQQNVSGPSADAQIKSSLSNLRSEAQLYYDTNKGYGPTSNSCTSGMFADKYIAQDISTVSTYNGKTTSCHSTKSAYAVGSVLKTNGLYWCVDSTGASKQTTKKLTATSCK